MQQREKEEEKEKGVRRSYSQAISDGIALTCITPLEMTCLPGSGHCCEM